MAEKFLVVLPLLSSLAILFMVGYVAGKGPKQPLNRAFYALFLNLFLLTLIEFLLRLASAPGTTALLLKCAGFLSSLSGVLFLAFVYTLIDRRDDWQLAVCGIAALATGLFSFMPGFSVGEVRSVEGMQVISARSMLLFICVFSVGVPSVLSVVLCARWYMSSNDGRRKGIMRLITWGATGGIGYALIVTFLIPSLLHWERAVQFSSLSVVIFAGAIYRAVTKYRFLSVDLEQIQEVARHLFDDMRDAVIIMDSQGAAVQMNGAARSLLDGEENIDPQRIAAHVKEYRFDESYKGTKSVWTGKGGQRTVILSQSHVKESDASLGKILLIRDVTEETRIEQELARARQIESLGVLAGGIAHDFNNLLMGITTSFSLCKDLASRDREMQEIIREGEKAAVSAGKLARQLLTFAKGSEPSKSAIDLDATIRDAVLFVLRGSRCTLKLTLAADIGTISADAHQLSQVFHNLALNAMQAMPEGGEITVAGVRKHLAKESSPVPATGEFVEITFSDQGVGIPRENIGKVFDPYFTTKPGGSGLGLTIVHSILVKHGGGIRISSPPGQGCVVTVYVPYVQAASVYGGTAVAMPAVSAAAGAVLIVDDDLIVRTATQRMISRLGYTAEAVESGVAALSRCDAGDVRGEGFCAFVVDLTMPGGMGGKELGERLLMRYPGAKVIVASGYHDDPVIARYTEFGFAAALSKPYDFQQLGAVLREVTTVVPS